MGDVLACLTLWWIGIPTMFSQWSAKHSLGGLDDATVRRFVGESRWHKQERLAGELREREARIHDAERELGIVP